MSYINSGSSLLTALVGAILVATCFGIGCSTRSRAIYRGDAENAEGSRRESMEVSALFQHIRGGELLEPSGRIAFVANQSGNWDLWTINADGTGPMQLTQTPLDERFPAWAPDGQTIVYSTSDGKLWTISADGSQTRWLTLDMKEQERRDNTHPVWSPDGRRIAFVSFLFDRDESEVWVIDADPGSPSARENLMKTDGNRPVELVSQKEIQINPTWSPDGRKIIYSSTIYGPAGKIIQDLWAVQSDGRNARRLLANDAANFHADWSPDGKRIAFTSDKSGNMDIWLLELETGSVIQITDSDAGGPNPTLPGSEIPSNPPFSKGGTNDAYDADPCWAPDSQNLAFVSNRTGTMQIWIVDITGQHPRQVTNMPGGCKDPSWSPGDQRRVIRGNSTRIDTDTTD